MPLRMGVPNTTEPETMSLTGASCTASSVASSHARCGRPSICAGLHEDEG